MKRTKTVTVEYEYFDVGTKITPTSTRCPLEMGQVYTVVRCHAPMFVDEEAVVFVEGHKTGVSTTYLREVRK